MKVLRYLDEHLEEVLLVIFTLTMVIVIGLQVFMRFVLSSSLGWSEELARYCFIWLVYIGISYGVKKQRHIKVDVMLLLLKERGKLILHMVANLFFLAFAIVIIIYGYDVMSRLMQTGQTSAALSIPISFVYAATPIGMGLTAIRIIQQIIKQIRTLLGKDTFYVKTEMDDVLERGDVGGVIKEDAKRPRT